MESIRRIRGSGHRCQANQEVDVAPNPKATKQWRRSGIGGGGEVRGREEGGGDGGGRGGVVGVHEREAQGHTREGL